MASSTHMEKEGLIRAMAHLEANDIAVETIVTDRHPQIQKWVREELPTVNHYYDVWHVAKSKFINHYYDDWHVAKSKFINHYYDDWHVAKSKSIVPLP